MASGDAEELVTEISRDAEAERERILAAALKRTQELQAATEAQVRRLAEENARRLQTRLAMERERIDGGIKVEEGRRRLEAMREGLEAAFSRARARLGELCSSPRYPDALAQLVREAVEAVVAPGEVAVARGDVARCRAALSALGVEASVRAEGEEPGTVIVTSSDDQSAVDNSIATRLGRLQLMREEEVARVLFRGAAP
jgi:vacuolar-type H+-ATPase subunit E/Vma4